MPKITGIKTAADVELQEVWDWGGTVTAESDPSLIPLVQRYKHFDLSDEELGHTSRYNCWGFTFLPRRYWIDSSDDVDQILTDNCVPVAPGSLRPGDVIRYRDSSNITTHTGRVWQVDTSGNCTLVRSKWGGWAEYVHVPLHPTITPVYGTNLAYFRQVAPLKGIGDLWIRDASGDNGEQYSNAAWASPDIMVDAPPYGSADVNPAFSQVNRVWAVVHNRSNADIAGVRVRYYWADPHAGFAPSNWQLIPGTAGHPNPTNGFTVAANSSAQAPFVEWTPVPVPGVADPAHQCLLAIAFVNDDPKDSSNPNPLVYPFEIRWENNIAARNVHVVTLGAGDTAGLDLGFGVPFDGVQRVVAALRLRLTAKPRLPTFGLPPRVIPPTVKVAIGDRRPLTLNTAGRVELFDREWGPRVAVRDIDFELERPERHYLAIPHLREKTIAWKEIKRLPVTAERALPLKLSFTAPRSAESGSVYALQIEQVVDDAVVGAYTVVIRIK